MAKLIGTDPNQVPTNADLGSAAYTNTQNMPETHFTNQPLAAKFGTNGDVPTDLATNLDFVQLSGSTFIQSGSDAQAFIKTNNYWNGAGTSYVDTTRGSTTIRLNENNAGIFQVETAPSGGTATSNRFRINENGYVTMPAQPTFSEPAYTNHSITTTGDVYMTSSNVFANTVSGTQTNIGNCWNASTGRFTAPVAGHYQFILSYGTIFSSGYLYVYLKKNGSTMAYAPSNQDGDWEHRTLSTIIHMNANDYMQGFWTNNYSGGYIGHVHFSGRLVG